MSDLVQTEVQQVEASSGHPGILITLKNLQGQLARFAVEQHPYGRPEGLFDAVEALRRAAQDWEMPSCRMRRFSDWSKLRAWLRSALETECPAILEEWNTPRSKHTETHVFSSRFNGPVQEDDFIDIHALFRNVAMEAWRDAVAFDAASAPQSIEEAGLPADTAPPLAQQQPDTIQETQE